MTEEKTCKECSWLKLGKVQCTNCKGTGRVNADIPISMVPDVNNCNFTEECSKCKGTGKVEYNVFEDLKAFDKIDYGPGTHSFPISPELYNKIFGDNNERKNLINKITNTRSNKKRRKNFQRASKVFRRLRRCISKRKKQDRDKPYIRQ